MKTKYKKKFRTMGEMKKRLIDDGICTNRDMHCKACVNRIKLFSGNFICEKNRNRNNKLI